MKTQIKRFLLTLGFMTRIPVNVDLGEVKDEDMHKGFLYYPVVGLILGLCDMAVFLLVSLIYQKYLESFLQCLRISV